MTFREFVTGAFYLPAKAFSVLSNLIFGSYQKNNKGSIRTDSKGKAQTNRGLFGLIVDGVRLIINFLFDAANYLARNVAHFISNHLQAIAIAFWSSLAVAGVVALTVALWPAALTAITTFTIAGVSIASVVGTGFAAQVAATAGLAAAITSAAVFVGATFTNAYIAVRDFFAHCCKPAKKIEEPASAESNNADDSKPSVNPSLSALNAGSPIAVKEIDAGAAPMQTASLFKAPEVEPDTNEDVDMDLSPQV
jgi:hypothetical protein